MFKQHTLHAVLSSLLCFGLFSTSCHAAAPEEEEEQQRSAAFNRYKANNLTFEQENALFPTLNFQMVTGLGYFGDANSDPLVQKKLDLYRKAPKGKPVLFKPKAKKFPELSIAYHLRHALDGFAENTTFRDPTSPIKIGDTYHIWYSKSWGPTEPVGQKLGSQEPYHEIKDLWKRIFSWDYVSIWHATSKDGYHWEEQGMALEPGKPGSYDDRCVFTPDILVANGKYYMYYQVARSPHTYADGPHEISMAWADSPEGPWTKAEEPVLLPSKSGGFDSRKVHDPSIIVKGGKYHMYYKGDGSHSDPTLFGEDFHIGWGVAIADKPEGPFVRSPLNPVIVGGHEVVVFPYESGVCGMIRQGPELHTMQCAKDGLNFEVVSHIAEIPAAGTFFRAGHFKDIDKHPAKLPTWGMSHDHRIGSGEAVMVRFDINFERTPSHKWFL